MSKHNAEGYSRGHMSVIPACDWLRRLNTGVLCVFFVVKVTAKGTGLNPNAKVWQEASAPLSHNAEEATGAPDWLQEDHAPSQNLDGN